MRTTRLLILVLFLPPLSGCGHKQATVSVPPPPELPPQATVTTPPLPSPANRDTTTTNAPVPATPVPITPNEKPLYTQLGLASWYGAPYHNRRGSNGQLYDMHAMTAAPRTLPLNSLVRVTNGKTGRCALVPITDRAPCTGERIVDYSQPAARAIDRR